MGNNSDKELYSENEDKQKFVDLDFHKFIINSLPVAVVTVTSNLKISSFNPWAEELTGYSASEAVGRSCGEVLQGGMCEEQCPLKKALSSQKPVVRAETTIQNRRGKTIPIRMNASVMLADNGKIIGAVEAFQDISSIKALEREKENFVSMIAHDIKSSVAIIGGFILRLLKKRAEMNEDKQDEYLEIIRNEAGKLESLTREFLEFSRLQSGQLKLNFSATSLDKELLELITAYEPRALKKGIKLVFESEDALPLIQADANRLHRVFTNLLDNALKFSKKNGKITIRTRSIDQDVVVQVIDHGVGIDSDDLPYIFDPFHRGQIGEKREGFGLGLAAVKAIVEKHGGNASVESEFGKGSIFTVTLPKAAK
jgi:PAS domain S-box-containing protein